MALTAAKKKYLSEKLLSSKEEKSAKTTESLVHKHKGKNDTCSRKGKSDTKFLITINVLGSAGPIRFVANCDDSAGGVIKTALKVYARQGRLPALGSDVNDFFLYPANAGFQAVEAWEEIGSCQSRNFVLCRKQQRPVTVVSEGKAGRWRAWLQKSLSLKTISDH